MSGFWGEGWLMGTRNPGSRCPKSLHLSAVSVQVSRDLPRDSPAGPRPLGHTGLLQTPSAFHPSCKGRFNLKEPALSPGFWGICSMQSSFGALPLGVQEPWKSR